VEDGSRRDLLGDLPPGVRRVEKQDAAAGALSGVEREGEGSRIGKHDAKPLTREPELLQTTGEQIDGGGQLTEGRFTVVHNGRAVGVRPGGVVEKREQGVVHRFYLDGSTGCAMRRVNWPREASYHPIPARQPGVSVLQWAAPP
jgi:hypothetical protein